MPVSVFTVSPNVTVSSFEHPENTPSPSSVSSSSLFAGIVTSVRALLQPAKQR